MYYNSNQLFSRQSPYNFVMGERGNGKSFEFKKRMIKNFIKKKEQSVYIRRRQTDIDNVKDNFFDDIAEFFPNNSFRIHGSKGYIDDELAIHFIALSTSYKVKSKPFPKVTLIVFDEYIEPAFKYPNYFKDDMFKLLELNNTISRDRNNWKLVLIGNAISYVNPFFSFFEIEVNNNKKRFQSFKYDDEINTHLITLELTETPEFKENYSKSLMARIIKGTTYGSYAMDSEVYEDNNSFIVERKKGNYYYVCTLKVRGTYVGVWLHEEGTYYIDDKLDKTTSHKFVLYDEDIEEGYKKFKVDSKNWRTKKLKEEYNNANVFFMNQEIKKLFITDIIKHI